MLALELGTLGISRQTRGLPHGGVRPWKRSPGRVRPPLSSRFPPEYLQQRELPNPLSASFSSPRRSWGGNHIY